ncbi:glycosyltransferase family 9 protein [Aggregatimonas sangjinii]|uniref:Glycosyltransferase family 9 protein n=1 Tax=Aggregatimonas sangjinii TaxID=2583587 RepID=A0A5B7SYH6_9FLAO|nr:glycosyltransferase family 9 protein [Aggregatimonas sangjinii]QCX01844.1 glycosyltransferase family 9 protein [Aggregatimonas sangjinii]
MNAKAHILVIRLSAMGDVAMTVPVLLALTQHYPELKITVLTRAFFTPMFSQMSNVTVFEADVKGAHKGLLGLWNLYKALKKMRFDAVADLHNVLRSNVLKPLFRLDLVPFYQIDKGRNEKRALTARKNKVFAQLRTTHQRYADVFSQMGYPIQLEKTTLLKKETLSGNRAKLLYPGNKKIIGIAPFAAFEGKEYPITQMGEVIKGLKDKGDYKIFLFGGGTEEKRRLDQFADGKDCVNTIGQLGFAEELALISNLDVMLAMDSGNAHLAAMCGIPTVTLWGVTHPFAGFAPFGQQAHTLVADRHEFPLIPTSVYGNKAPEGYEKAIASIAPQTVVDKILELSVT